MSDVKRIAKEAAIQIGSGGSAGNLTRHTFRLLITLELFCTGFVEVCIMHPLDLVKTRLQIQSGKTLTKNDPKYYSGIFDCFRKMYKYEGLTSFWKGIIPPILAETPKRAVKVP
jgi:solute carrier family 25 2-oxodicarboxylate transporter 21